jgi:hypothetical protein
VPAGAQGAVGLQRHATALADVLQRTPELEGAELDLVDDRREVGDLEHGLDVGRTEVRDADRARVAAFLGTLHPVPGPGRPALWPVDDVQVDVVQAEALEAALHLGGRVAPSRVELGRDEDILPR